MHSLAVGSLEMELERHLAGVTRDCWIGARFYGTLSEFKNWVAAFGATIGGAGSMAATAASEDLFFPSWAPGLVAFVSGVFLFAADSIKFKHRAVLYDEMCSRALAIRLYLDAKKGSLTEADKIQAVEEWKEYNRYWGSKWSQIIHEIQPNQHDIEPNQSVQAHMNSQNLEQTPQRVEPTKNI